MDKKDETKKNHSKKLKGMCSFEMKSKKNDVAKLNANLDYLGANISTPHFHLDLSVDCLCSISAGFFLAKFTASSHDSC